MDEAVRLNPTRAVTYTHRGVVWHRERDFARALADFSAAIRLDPSDPIAFNNRGGVRLAMGDPDGAPLITRRRSDWIPPAPRTTWSGARSGTNSGNSRRRSASSTGRSNSLPRTRRRTSTGGCSRHERGDHDAAIADFDAALERDPGYAAAFASRGATRVQKRDPAGAIADFDRAIELAPGDANGFFLRAATRHQRREFEKALADYTEAIRLAPTNPALLTGRGAVHL